MIMEEPVKIIVYIRGGMCINVVTNLPEDSWEYGLVDYDNQPDLPDQYNPFPKEAYPVLPDVGSLMEAAQKVIDRWETGDLAEAVRALHQALHAR